MSITRLRESSSKYIKYGVYVLAAVFFIGCFTMYTGSRNNENPSEGGTGSVLATVNGEEISRLEFDQRYNQQANQARDMGGINPLQEPMIKSGILRSLISERIQVEAAKKAGVKVGFFEVRKERKKMVDQQMDQIRQMFAGDSKKKLSDKEFANMLAKQSKPMTIQSLKTDIEQSLTNDVVRQQLLVQKLQDQVTEKVGKIDDNKLKDSYRMLQVRQIIIATDPTPEAQAKSKAEKILKEIKGGADFATLAKKHSDDTYTKDKGGDAGLIPVMYDKDLRGMKVGEVSDVLKTNDGFRIVKIESETLQIPPDFEKKKKDYREQVKTSLVNEELNDILQKAETEAKIKVNDPELNGYWLLTQIQTKPNEKDKLMKEAIKSLSKATLDNSQSPTAYIMLAQMYQLQGNNKKALVTLSDVLDGRQLVDYPELRYMQAQLFLTTGDKDKAIEKLKAASVLAYTNPNVGIHMQIQSFAKQLGLNDLVAQEDKRVKEIEAAQAAAQARTNPAPANMPKPKK